MEEEEFDIYRPAIDKIKEDPLSYSLIGGSGTASGATTFNPKMIGSAAEGRMIKSGQANLRNPAYRNLLGKAKGTIGKNVVKAGGIPLTAALVAGDIVSTQADETQQSMQRMSDIEESQISDAGAMAAERLRKLNLIEEQRSFDEGRPVFGGEEGITMGNLDEYFAANPDFSGIGDIQVPGSGYDQEGKFLPQLPENYDPNITTGAPALDLPGVTEGKIDYSSAFQGNQVGAEQSNSIANSPLGIMTNVLENLPSSVTDDQRAEIASGMLKPYLTTSQEDFNARNKEVFDKADAEYKERFQDRSFEDKELDRGSARTPLGGKPDRPNLDLTLGDYRNILRSKGIKGSGQMALAKQMMRDGISGRELAALERRKTEAAIAKSQRPERERAPSAAEFDFGISQTMSNLRGLMDSGQELNPQQQATFDAGNAYLRMKSEFGESPFEQVDQANIAPTYTDAEQKMIDKMKAKYPDRPEVEIIEALRADKRIK